MSSVLQYQSSAVPAAPSEFDYHFEQELSRRLRRRVLWYCGITVIVSLLVLLPGIISGGKPAFQISPNAAAAPPPVAAKYLSYVTSGLSLVLYIAAFVIVWRKPMRRESVLRLALWLYVLASIPGLIGTRVILQLAIPPGFADTAIAEEMRGRQRRAAIDAAGLGPPRVRLEQSMAATRAAEEAESATTAPAAGPTTTPAGPSASTRAVLTTLLQPAMFFALFVPFVMLIHHTFACLFIPWTFRQSLAPAVLLMLLVAVIFLLDFVGGGLHWIAAVVALPLTALTFFPGSAFCWWRFKGISRDIRLTFDSDRLRTMQAEMNSAKRILESALPPQRTSGPVRVSYVYEPMRQIGGDLLFVHPQANSKQEAVSVVLLDVTGHGVAAALSVNRLIGELERLFAESPNSTPADVLETLNSYVYFTMARHDMYVTAIAMRIDPANKRLTFTSAGHPTAYVRRGDGEIIELESTTMLLGIAEGDLFAAEPIEISLRQGDVVVAYTDGASEARSEATMQMLGMQGVRRLVEEVAAAGSDPAGWPAEIMRRVATYRAAPPLDDTLLVGVRLHA